MTIWSQYFDIKTSHRAIDDLVKPILSSAKVLTLEVYELLHRDHCSVFTKLTSLFDSVFGELEKAQNIIEQKDKTIQNWLKRSTKPVSYALITKVRQLLTKYYNNSMRV